MLDRPVRVGFLGAGNVLPAYLQVLDRLAPRGLASEGAICARDRETWDRLRARRPGIRLVAEVDAVLASDADAVVVITSHDSHAELVGRALESGKHVLVEKPLAPTRAEGEALVRAARERGLILLVAPFVQLSPTFRQLWTMVQDGAIGHVHSARGLYGNAGPDWAAWFYTASVGLLAELGIYNLKSLTALLGPVAEVQAAEAVAVPHRFAGGTEIESPGPDVSHVLLRHESGALSTIASSHAIQRYRRPGLELYGTEGTANLLGDDWDPRGLEVWRNETARWEVYEPLEPTWLWADGLRELVLALRDGRPPLADSEHDLHLLDVVQASSVAAAERAAIQVSSSFGPLSLRLEPGSTTHVHDHTRPADEQ
jgi:predicted dehydrogenase